MEENEDLTEQIKEYKRKISMIKDCIEQMDRSYEDSKRYIVIQRYRLLKTMIKTVTHNQWIWVGLPSQYVNSTLMYHIAEYSLFYLGIYEENAWHPAEQRFHFGGRIT